jgi:predicted helicase
MARQSLIDRPKELLELINNCLKEPNKKETQLYGEVFTHMNIIYEMLDNLDKYYIKTYNKSFFTIKDFKWFDPAVGMGNFIVAVYLRLYQGLKEQIPNDIERKQHIIENMLYMSELKME